MNDPLASPFPLHERAHAVPFDTEVLRIANLFIMGQVLDGKSNLQNKARKFDLSRIP
jgi:hypothetical protein